MKDLCDYNDAYIVFKGTFTVSRPNSNAYDKNLSAKNNAPLISCISKTYDTLTDNAEDLEILMPVHSLLEYNKNYSKTSGSLLVVFNHSFILIS